MNSPLALLEPSHLEHVEGCLAALQQKLNSISEKKVALEDSEKNNKVAELYDMVTANQVKYFDKYGYWHQILSVLIQNTNNSIFFTCTLGHVKKSGIIGALNLRRLKFDASTFNRDKVKKSKQ